MYVLLFRFVQLLVQEHIDTFLNNKLHALILLLFLCLHSIWDTYSFLSSIVSFGHRHQRIWREACKIQYIHPSPTSNQTGRGGTDPTSRSTRCLYPCSNSGRPNTHNYCQKKQLQPLEDAIHQRLVPRLTRHSPPGNEETDIFALPPRLGGIGLTNCIKQMAIEQVNSQLVTVP